MGVSVWLLEETHVVEDPLRRGEVIAFQITGFPPRVQTRSSFAQRDCQLKLPSGPFGSSMICEIVTMLTST